LRLRLGEDCVRPGRRRRDDEIELAAHDAHADHVAAGDRAALQDLRHVLLAAHDPNRLGRGERHLLRGPGERLAQADLVVDAHARVPALHPVHPDDSSIRVLGISAADPGGGGLRALDEDDVPFLQVEDLHDPGVGSSFRTRTSRTPSFGVAAARSALTSSGKLSTRWRAWYVRSRYS